MTRARVDCAMISKNKTRKGVENAHACCDRARPRGRWEFRRAGVCRKTGRDELRADVGQLRKSGEDYSPSKWLHGSAEHLPEEQRRPGIQLDWQASSAQGRHIAARRSAERSRR